MLIFKIEGFKIDQYSSKTTEHQLSRHFFKSQNTRNIEYEYKST